MNTQLNENDTAMLIFELQNQLVKHIQVRQLIIFSKCERNAIESLEEALHLAHQAEIADCRLTLAQISIS